MQQSSGRDFFVLWSNLKFISSSKNPMTPLLRSLTLAAVKCSEVGLMFHCTLQRPLEASERLGAEVKLEVLAQHSGFLHVSVKVVGGESSH